MPGSNCSAGCPGIPGADVRFAMASSASEAKRAAGPRQDLGQRRSSRSTSISSRPETDAVFLAVPETLAAELGPALADRGPRVFDLSGAFRLRDDAERQRWYPHSPATLVDVALRA